MSVSIRTLAARVGAAGAAAAFGLALAGPSRAALVIDDFLANDGVHGLFPTVEALTYGTNSVEATGFHNVPGHVVGGERDVRTRVTNTQVYPTDGGAGIVRAQAGQLGPFVNLGIGVDFGAAGDFLLQYDGVDGSINRGAGLNLDIAATGDAISLTGIYNYFIVGPGYAPSDLVVRLTDMSGRSAALTRTLGPAAQFQTLTYGFAAFEAANAQIDLHHLGSIELSGNVRNEIPGTGFMNLYGFGVGGAAYTTTNVISAAPEVSAAPEPAAWTLMIAGFGFAGASLRRRRRALVAQ